jgi:hypothetical protein
MLASNNGGAGGAPANWQPIQLPGVNGPKVENPAKEGLNSTGWFPSWTDTAKAILEGSKMSNVPGWYKS